LELLVAIALGAAAFAARRAVKSRRPAMVALGAGVVLVALAWSAGVLDTTPSSIAGRQATGMVAAGQPLSLAVSGVSVAALLAAACEFGRWAWRGQRHVALLSGASILLAVGLLQYTVIRVDAADWVTPADVLRIGALLLLFLFAALEYADGRRELARDALRAERQRIARDLHDGLAQDLAFIATQSQRFGVDGGQEHPVTVAARRALAISRSTIVDLSASTAPSTERALRTVADELEDRFAVQIGLVLEGGRAAANDLQRTVREEVVRIAREALVNAIRHGGATRLTVVLDLRGGSALLRVIDNGSGIQWEPDRHAHGFGLASMRSRAASIGGRIVAARRTGGGTEVQVVINRGRVAS
jgi:signal transduction histidine kinase